VITGTLKPREEEHFISAERIRKERRKLLIENVRDFLGRYKRNRAAVLGLAIVIVGVIVALFPQLFATHEPFEVGHPQLQPPSRTYFLGTDNLGRDMYSRAVWGTRAALLVAIGSAGLSAILGVLLGAASGYYGGALDDLLSRIFEVFMMIPRFFLILVIVALFGSSLALVTIMIGITWWPANARIMRSQVLTLKSRAYVQASGGLGASPWQILAWHIIPNGIYPVITNSALEMGVAILIEAGLSFLGLGDPNIVSWGQLIDAGRYYVNLAWWMTFFPGLMMLVLVLAFNLIGDGIAHALNPRLAERV